MSGAAASLTTLLSTAIREGRAAVAVSGSLLRDAEVALALRDRAALAPISLAGKASPPLVEPTPATLARCGVKGGVLILVEPDAADGVGLQKLAEAAVQLTVKPAVVVVGRNPDKFTLMRLFGRVEHLAERGKGWLVGAPVPAATAAAPPPSARPPRRRARSPPTGRASCSPDATSSSLRSPVRSATKAAPSSSPARQASAAPRSLTTPSPRAG